MKRCKKALSVAVALALVLSLCPGFAALAEEEQTYSIKTDEYSQAYVYRPLPDGEVEEPDGEETEEPAEPEEPDGEGETIDDVMVSVTRAKPGETVYVTYLDTALMTEEEYLEEYEKALRNDDEEEEEGTEEGDDTEEGDEGDEEEEEKDEEEDEGFVLQAPTGKYFDQTFLVNGAVVEDCEAFTMPEGDVSITAVLKQTAPFTIDLRGGTAEVPGDVMVYLSDTELWMEQADGTEYLDLNGDKKPDVQLKSNLPDEPETEDPETEETETEEPEEEEPEEIYTLTLLPGVLLTKDVTVDLSKLEDPFCPLSKVTIQVVSYHTVKWLDADGTLLQTDKNVPKGVKTTYKNQKTIAQMKPYLFKAWKTVTDPKTGDVTNTATYTENVVAKDLTLNYTSISKLSINTRKAGAQVILTEKGKKVATLEAGKNGIAEYSCKALVPGTYTFIVTFENGYKKSVDVKVNHILTLQTATIKKSATKKLTLKPKLKKVDGKYLKGKTITLKFNGKKYKAKTDKKGIAKFTFKKDVLRKLKVGKTYKVQVTYLKDTIKKSVKVRK
jgi:hypothetical protein